MSTHDLTNFEDGIYELQVGEKRFKTSRRVLRRAGYFDLLFGRGNTPEFFDLDGSIFEHVLRFLRHGVAPCFGDQISEFAVVSRCYMLRDQAKYFMVPNLFKWAMETLSSSAAYPGARLVDWVDSGCYGWSKEVDHGKEHG